MRTRLVAELHETESHSRRCCESRSPVTQKTGKWRECPLRWVTGFRPRIKYVVTFFLRGDVLSWE